MLWTERSHSKDSSKSAKTGFTQIELASGHHRKESAEMAEPAEKAKLEYHTEEGEP